MLLNQSFVEVNSNTPLEFDSRTVIRALNDDTTSALHQLCQVMEQYGAERLFESLRINNRFVFDYGSMNVENLITTLRMYYVLDTEEDFSTYAAESDRVTDQIADCANDSYFGSKTDARIKELGDSLPESVTCDFQARHTDIVDDKIRNYNHDVCMCIKVQGDMSYSDIINKLFTNSAFIHAVEHGAKFSIVKCAYHSDDVYRVPSYIINLTATLDDLALDKYAATHNFINIAKFCICHFGAERINDMSGMQLELFAREAVHVTC